MAEPTHRCEDFLEAIDELVDGTLAPPERAALEAHLAACPDCRRLADDFQRIRATASTLERKAPPAHVWTAIAAALGAEEETRRPGRSPARWRWMAVAAALLLVTAAVLLALWTARPAPVERAGTGTPAPLAEGPAVEPAGGAAPDASDIVESIEAELRSAEDHYLRAIAGLEQIARSEPQTLDPQLAETLQTNIEVIDRAIGESRQALQADPASRPAQQSLFEALRRKVSLLQETIALMNEMRKGNEAEAGRIVEGINKS
jgi:hypothetical protein